MEKHGTKVSIFGAILISLLLYASISVTAQPYYHYTDGGYMKTEVSDVGVSALAVAYDQTVYAYWEGEVGPDVIINVSCYAWDNSTVGIQGSDHKHNLTVEYLGNYYYDQWDKWLDEGTSDTHILQVILRDVTFQSYAYTTLYCWVQDSDWPYSWDDDTDNGTIYIT